MANTEKIIIELDFDTSDFTQSAAKLNKEISTLNKEQRALKRRVEKKVLFNTRKTLKH